MTAKRNNNKKNILFRYAVISTIFLIVSAAVVYKLFQTTVIEAAEWNARAEEVFAKVDTIDPERGDILADNGSILACNLRVYDIKIDLRHNKVLQESNKIRWEAVDSLADSLDMYYPRRKDLARLPAEEAAEYSWHRKLKEELEKPDDKRMRALVVAKKSTLDDFKRIKGFPWIRDFKGVGSRCPLYTEARDIRMYPFGKMAFRSIGRVNENEKTGETHGYSGLEKDLDTLLYGKAGLAKRVALTKGISNWVKTPARRGYDIRTTINIDMQDMLEEELLNVCTEANAEWGTAILMEVATGEIKAISNIEKLEDGSYGEALNRAVLAYEPGSVMKPISLMIAFEDGLVKSVDDLVDCSPFQRTSDPHGGGMKNMKQVIEQSSNTGIARVIFRGYADDPSKFHDRLSSIGFFDKIHSGIADECTPRVRKLLPKDKNGLNVTMTARHLDLARQAYGYNTEIPPLYTLAIYNAIANGGRFVRPHLVRSLIDEDGRDSVIPISYVRDRICSEETAAKVRRCIHEVVWGEHGTARAVRDDRVKVVGKTGTAYPVEANGYNHAKRRYAFAGFFPYETPKYSCMALVLGPSGTSANRTSGQVVKNMAVKMFARGMLDNQSTYSAERRNDPPVMSGSLYADPQSLASGYGMKGMKRIKTSAGGPQGVVPDVRGYDIRSAVAILERKGLNVRLCGTGRVTGQSPAAGTRLRKGETITLTLKI